MIKTTFATEVFIIANTKAIKLNDITKPPSKPARPAFFIVRKASFLYIDNKNTETPKKKKNDLNNKKKLFSKLQNQFSVKKVFNELSKRYNNRKGGYSRVLKAGFRTGDDAPMAVIELVDRDTNAKKIDKPKKTDPAKKEKEPVKKAAAK